MKRPNIVQFVSDDTSHEMLGYGGGPVLTPTIDDIGRRGVIFDNLHCPASVCMAARYSIMTGHYNGRCPDPSFRESYPTDRPYFMGFNTYLNPDYEKSLGHVLQAAGYRTGYVGKWHMGPPEHTFGAPRFDLDDDPADPEIAARLRQHQQALCERVRRCGFDEAGGISWANPQPGGRQIRRLEIHNLEWMTHAALGILERFAAEDRPFYLHYAPTPIHGNGHIESLLTDPRLTPEGYRDDHLGSMPERATIYERLIDAGLAFDYITAGALWMDDAIAAVREAVRRLGLEEDTVFIYSSDHGACEDKYTLYQGGTRIPGVMCWPAGIPGGRTVGALCQHIDWLPTLAEAAGATIPDDMRVDGTSFLPVVSGSAHETPGRDDLYFEYGHARAVRTQRWKYLAVRLPEASIESMRAGEVERALNHRGSLDIATCLSVERHPDYFATDQLYDLVNDPGERHNLANDPAYAPVVDEMRTRLARYLDTFEHPYPLDRPPDPFFATPEFADLCRPYENKDRMNEVLWWRKKWHHRPGEVELNGGAE